MLRIIQIEDILNEPGSGRVRLLDARSPAEYEQGHVPGALNLPLLNNEERHLVGLTYREHGHNAAVRIGFELTGPKFSGFIDTATELAPDKIINLYCWRGGLRSNVMGWILSTAGFDVRLIKGGYKTYRNWALQKIKEPKNIWILGGKTGSGKSEILQALRENQQQVLDLENLAHHKGSTFGGLGQKPQPTQEQFENNLAIKWNSLQPDVPTWVEDESRWIGKIKIPDAVYDLMLNTKYMIRVERNISDRKKRILNEYAHFPVEHLAERTSMLAKRLGGDRLKESLEHLNNGNFDGWVEVMLEYYDKTYSHSLERKKMIPISNIEISELPLKGICDQLTSLASINTHGIN